MSVAPSEHKSFALFRVQKCQLLSTSLKNSVILFFMARARAFFLLFLCGCDRQAGINQLAALNSIVPGTAVRSTWRRTVEEAAEVES